jgi:hypothetical protein
VNKWTVEYDNDTGPNDEGYWEWWDVSDGTTTFKAFTDESAKWLCVLLNRQECTDVSEMGK